MKTKIVFKDNINNSVDSVVVNNSGRDHLEAQIRYKSYVIKDKKIYSRKQKHKKRLF